MTKQNVVYFESNAFINRVLWKRDPLESGRAPWMLLLYSILHIVTYLQKKIEKKKPCDCVWFQADKSGAMDLLEEYKIPICCGVCCLELNKARVHYGGGSCYPCRAFFRLQTSYL